MDEEEAKTEFCSNCRRDIPAANFVMHVTHCQRNLTLCKECGEPVPTSQQEEHFEEYHAKEKCDCGQLVEKMNLEEHKEKDCPNRGVECQYCELTLPFNKMSSHVEYCGSRTEKCDICERFIQMKDLTEHVNTGCQYPPIKEESKKLPSNPPHDFLSEMPVGMLHAMGLMDPSVNGTDADYFHPFRAGMREFGQIINTGLGTSPFSDPRMQYPGGAAYFGGISAGNGVIDGSDVIARGAKRSREFPKPEYDQRISRGFDKVDDDDEYSQDVDDDEMLAAAYQADAFDIANGNVNRTSSAMVDDTFPYMFMKSTLMADSANDADKTQLPCEFCGDLFPVDTLIMHQSGCQLSSLDSIQSHSTFVRDRKFQTNHTEPETKARKSSEDDTFLPCEFCQELFPFENLIAHQAVCDACPASRPPSELDGPTPRPLLNNARPQVRNGSTSRPSRPVYESKKSQKAITNYIPSELDDGDDLDFTPTVKDNSTTKDPSHKPEKYSDRHRGHDISLMNNELQRQDRRAANHQSMPGQAVLRNNDFANRQPNKDALRVKNRTAEQHMRGQPEAKEGTYSTSSKAPAAKPLEDKPAVLRNTNLTNHQSMPGQAVLRNNDRPALRTKNRTAEQHMRGQPDPRVGKHVTSSKAPGAKPLEDGQGQKNAGSRAKPAAELVTKPNRGRPNDSATRSQPRQPSMNDEMEPTRRGSGHKISHRSEAKASKSRRPDNGGFQSDLSSASREASSHNSRTKTRGSLPPIGKPVSHNGSSSVFPGSNPRRNPPTAGPAENGIRNRPDSPTRPSNTEPSTQPRKLSSTRKKIV